jgi:hypothetical protein
MGFIKLLNTQLVITVYKLLVTGVLTFFTALLGSGFQQCGVLGFRVRWLLFSLAGSFKLQLPN